MVKDTARVIRYVYTWEHDREMASHVHVQRTQLMQQEVGLNCQLKSQSSRWPLTRVESREGSEVESIDWVDRQLSWIDCVARFDRFWGLLWKSLKTNKVLESGWIRREERDELPCNRLCCLSTAVNITKHPVQQCPNVSFNTSVLIIKLQWK